MKLIFWIAIAVALVLVLILIRAYVAGNLSGLASSLTVGGNYRYNQGNLYGYSTFPSYYLSEPVRFGVRNDGKTTFNLKNSAPWTIQNGSGQVIFSPVAAQVITPIASGQSKEWTWNQKSNDGKFVASGKYQIVLDIGKIIIPFYINNQQGSQGFFTFSVYHTKYEKSTFRIRLNNSQAIRDVIENYYKLNNKHIPIGPLIDKRPGKSVYDSQWSWEMDSGKTVMAETTIELCDGHPLYDVEQNLDYWIENVKQFCPWDAYVESLN